MTTEANGKEKFLAGKKVLLIEEDRVTVRLTKKLLEELWGATVDIALDSKSAVEALKNNYDLILMGIVLPENPEDANQLEMVREEIYGIDQKIFDVEHGVNKSINYDDDPEIIELRFRRDFMVRATHSLLQFRAGLEILEALKPQIPILIVTTQDMDDVYERLAALGLNVRIFGKGAPFEQIEQGIKILLSLD